MENILNKDVLNIIYEYDHNLKFNNVMNDIKLINIQRRLQITEYKIYFNFYEYYRDEEHFKNTSDFIYIRNYITNNDNKKFKNYDYYLEHEYDPDYEE
jgi:hypothetical protein